MNRKTTFLSLFVVLVISLALTCPDAVADTIYVKEGGTGSGTSWDDAYGDLQDGLDDADPCDVIWVAEGTYYPTSDYGLGIGDRGKHFRMKNGVKIYGGFPDTWDPDMTDRDPNRYETILSGELGTTQDPNDNCYHVFYHPNGLSLDHSAILDGFIITGGNANGPYQHVFGGGMYNDYHNSPTVMNCTFRGNSADEGGGMSNTYSSPNVINCTFFNNSAGDAGGMYNYDGSNPTVAGCTFSGNSADHYGGGMTNYFFSNPTVTDCTFEGNLAERGGGMANAVGMVQFGDPTVINCIFSGNTAIYEGGGMFNYRTCPIITGCTLTGNWGGSGGGMYNTYSSNPIVTNCIIWGNNASSGGNEIALIESSTIDVAYCDVQGGQAGIYDDGSGNTINWGSGNIDADPEFVDPNGLDGIVGTEDDNLRLSEGSACIDAGNNSAVTGLTDPDGHRRIIDGDGDGEAFVDMGAYEYYGPDYEPIVIYVNTGALGGCKNGLSWEDAFISLQDALDAAMISDEIWVAQGIYKPSVEVGGMGERYKTFQMKNGVKIYGGFPDNGDPGMADRDPNMYETILSGDLNGDDGLGLFYENKSDNCYHVFYHPDSLSLETSAIIDGFTIIGGKGKADGSLPHDCGGGMYNYNSSPTVTNCTFNDNSAKYGCGMWNEQSSPTVTDCTFSGNWACGGWLFHGYGGGMCNHVYSSPTVTGCKFSKNIALSGGGICNSWYSNPIVADCTFTSNSAEFEGGGMTNFDCSPIVTNCTFSSNIAGLGGGFWNYNSSPAITNCTLTDNWASSGGGMCNYNSSPTVANCILWGNTAPSGNEIGLEISSTINIAYCDVEDGQAGIYDDGSGNTINWGSSNIDTNPLFIRNGHLDDNGTPDVLYDDIWIDGNYRLQEDSPCIDTGDNSVVDANSTDLDGNWRILDGDGDGEAIVDLGAYEVAVPPVAVEMKFTPQALNPGSQGNWVKAHLVLPEGFGVDDVDAGTPAEIEQLGIESEYMDVFINEEGLVEIEAAFRRGDFCGGVDFGPAEVTVTSRLIDGRYLCGTDIIKIISNKLKYIDSVASRWLETDCAGPDWCGGLDVNRDSVVNFVDFALLDGCCIEIISQ
jgi:hypothetical protein